MTQKNNFSRKSLFTLMTLSLFGSVTFAKSVVLKKVNIKVNITNEIPRVSIRATGADTYLSCVTKYSEGGGESGTTENAVTPDTKINAKMSAINTGDNLPINIVILKEESLTAPKKLLNQGKECELSLGLSMDLLDTDSKNLIGNVNQIYGAGININHGFPLIGTANTRTTDLKIDQDLQLNLKLKSEYGGTKWTPDGRVPYCNVILYKTDGKTDVEVGRTYLDLSAEHCKIP